MTRSPGLDETLMAIRRLPADLLLVEAGLDRGDGATEPLDASHQRAGLLDELVRSAFDQV